MRPSQIILHSRWNYSLVFKNVDAGDKFGSYEPFDRPSEIAIIKIGDHKDDVVYATKKAWEMYVRDDIDKKSEKLMNWHTAFDIEDLPEVDRAYLCSWQNMYRLFLFTDFEEPFLLNTNIRRKDGESIDSMREACENFLRQSYQNNGIKVEQIYDEDFYDFEYGCPHCGWKGDIDDAKIKEKVEGAEEPYCPECDEELIRMR